MNLTYLLLLHTYPSPHHSSSEHETPRPEDPQPEGGERETAGDDDEEPEPDTLRNDPAPEPATPDANPIDPRVLNGDRDHG